MHTKRHVHTMEDGVKEDEENAPQTKVFVKILSLRTQSRTN